MKNKIVLGILTGLALGLLAAVSFAAGGDRIEATIPFAFVAGQEHYPAGNYVFEVNDPDNPNILTVETENGERNQYILGKTVETVPAHYDSAVVFDEVGNEHFLVKAYVRGEMQGVRLTKGEIQKEMESAGGRAKTLEIKGNVS